MISPSTGERGLRERNCCLGATLEIRAPSLAARRTFKLRTPTEVEPLEPPAPPNGQEHFAIDQVVVLNDDANSDERLRTCTEGGDLQIRGVRRKLLNTPLCCGDGPGVERGGCVCIAMSLCAQRGVRYHVQGLRCKVQGAKHSVGRGEAR